MIYQPDCSFFSTNKKKKGRCYLNQPCTYLFSIYTHTVSSALTTSGGEKDQSEWEKFASKSTRSKI